MIDPDAIITAVIGPAGHAWIERVRIGDWFAKAEYEINDGYDRRGNQRKKTVHVLSPKRGNRAYTNGWYNNAYLIRLKTKEGLIARFIGTRQYWPERYRDMRGELTYHDTREFEYMYYTATGRVACMLFDMTRSDIEELVQTIDPGAYAIEMRDTGVAADDLRYDDVGGESEL